MPDGCAARTSRIAAPSRTSIVDDWSVRRCTSRVALTTVGAMTAATSASEKSTRAMLSDARLMV
jgi:hypothetical protein